ncbi:hypothetical protein P43SY_006150 [Pythium insidiosum]|uniref:Protein kinase domain-containing protein n=1 Tax=Pythium insidiosum TaxID=114742 RepID=A0AAD5LL26_PYTIN|nr:hypothetical protein P43SY_006150 [Pythium insidiosum]
MGEEAQLHRAVDICPIDEAKRAKCVRALEAQASIKARELHMHRSRVRHATALVAAVALSSITHASAATACAKSGVVAPRTGAVLVADPTSPSSQAILVTPDCAEISIVSTLSTEWNAPEIVLKKKQLMTVTSFPAVAKLDLTDNLVSSFAGTGATLKDLDLTNNQISTLEGFHLPSSLERLTLDFNPIKSLNATDVPSSLRQLMLKKCGITSLSSFDFPKNLQEVYLDGNQDLTTLEGLVLPGKLRTLRVSGSSITSFIVQESDVPILENLETLQLGNSVSTSCPDNTNGKIQKIKTYSACVLDDTVFSVTFTTASRAPAPEAPTPTPSNRNGGATGTQIVETNTGGGDGMSATMLVIVGALVLVAVLVGAMIAWVFQRRRRQHEPLPTGAPSGKTNDTDTKTVRTADISSSNTGFLDNDVRNDEDLIPHRLPHNEIRVMSELCTGGFGIVYKATLYGQVVVVKQVAPLQTQSTEVLCRFMDEIRLYARLNHPKIVGFIGLTWTNLLDLSLVMEFMPRGDLHALLSANAALPNGRQALTWFGESSESRSKSLFAQDITEALVYLHSFDAPIIHRDIKSKNVLLAEDYTAKLSDFGISTRCRDDTMTGGMGTTAWMAPEVLQGERYSERADIYSLGILLCELDVCGHPYAGNREADPSFTEAKIAYLVSTASLKPRLHADCPTAIARIIARCLDFDPSKRPTAVELHYDLRKVREACLEWAFYL